MDHVAIRSQFSLLADGDLHYLDSAATSLKPEPVIERIADAYRYHAGSPHRGAHRLSIDATERYAASKERLKRFVNACEHCSVVYTKNSSEALNLIAASVDTSRFQPGDKIVIPITAHHSNILPWQRLAAREGLVLEYLYCDSEGYILADELQKIDARTQIVSLPLVANGLGTVHDALEIFRLARRVGAICVADAAQAIGHIPLDFINLGADFLVLSAHKCYGPQGIGALIGKRRSLQTLRPFLLGGDMIEYVEEQSATFAPIPERFEAGTQNVAGAIGLMAALDWMDDIGTDAIIAHNRQLTDYLYQRLSARRDIDVYGPNNSARRGSLVSFSVRGVHPHDVATILDSYGVAIRAGHHCCQPLMHYANTLATCRASIGIYNNEGDIDALIQALDRVTEVFHRD